MTADASAALVAKLRACRGLTQTEVADRTGLTQSTVSRIESGKTVTDDATTAVARVLGVTTDYIQGAVPVVPSSQPLLRSYHDAHKTTVDQHLARADLVADLIERAQLRTVRNQLPFFAGDPNDLDDIDDHALEVRHAARIADNQPVPNSIQTAENLGCVALPMDDELGRHLGMSTWSDRHPVLFVARALGRLAEIPGDRQRFTVSHELGHLTMHEGARVPADATAARNLERQAHRFASAFLLPTEQAIVEYDRLRGRITLRGLASIKERWGIAIKALVKRYSGLGIISDDHARSLYKQISSRGWTRNEPIEVGGEAGRWLRRALERKAPHGADAVAWAARTTGVPDDIVRDLIRWEAENSRVIRLQPDESRHSTDERHEAEIVSLKFHAD